MQYGRIKNIDLKGGERGRTFAFVEFEDPRCDYTLYQAVKLTSVGASKDVCQPPLCETWLASATASPH